MSEFKCTNSSRDCMNCNELCLKSNSSPVLGETVLQTGVALWKELRIEQDAYTRRKVAERLVKMGVSYWLSKVNMNVQSQFDDLLKELEGK